MFSIFLNKKVHFISFIVLVHLLFSYYYFPYYFSSLIGTGLIVLFSYFTWKKKFNYWMGVQIPKKEIPYVLFAILLFGVGSWFAIKVVARNANIQLIPGNFKNLVHILFYTLNEEIILGSILLKGIKHWKKRMPDWILSAAVAAIFSLIHFVFFKWIFTVSGTFHIFTLLSLFAVGIFRNNTILRSGHIGYAWALHFSWIFVVLGCSHLVWTEGVYLNDFERFELYLGDVRILGLCVGLVIFSFMKFEKSTSSG